MAVGAADGRITAGASRGARLLAWVAERHGPALLVPILLIYGVAIATGAASAGATSVPATDLVLGAVGAWLWFLVLRVVDDLGDRDADDRAHPDRLLQRGVVAPNELRGLAAAGLALQAATCLIADGGLGPVGYTWLAGVAITAVVASDASAPPFLAARPLLARMLRVPASALPVLWWAQLGSGGTGLTGAAAVLAVVAILVVVVIDVARKLEPAAEGQTSWSDSLGERRALSILAAAVTALGCACVGLLAAAGAASIMPVLVIAAAIALGIAGLVRGSGQAAVPALLVLLLTTLIALVVGA